MQLNKLIIETRVRTAWSAIDLGFMVARLYYLRSVLLYLIVAVPVFCLSRFVADVGSVLPYLVLWWCKPLFERPILFLLSRELFSESMTLASTLRHYRSWLGSGLIRVLTTRRLSFVRAMYAPITMLEQPSSSEYGKRASVLGYAYSSEATWLTIVMYHVETFFSLALLVLLVIFFPDQVTVSLAWLTTLDNNIYVDVSYLLLMAVVAPFYTAAGFMLYISRRVALEGWDIEICFRDWMSAYHNSAAPKVNTIETRGKANG